MSEGSVRIENGQTVGNGGERLSAAVAMATSNAAVLPV
ncbi:hypothetical protein H4W29_000550 [Rhizobium viscosum]|uniref:Uncharacterized protein n=1 Tax=Rhizobium viscosum TaxID=1673 RepID=A0ABR9IJL5_RHIVS|nr:hypothetical protein [Rhizobium viscosum]